MKKSILIILIVLLAFAVWSVLAFGKAKKEEGVKQPMEIQKAEPGPAPEDFPEVVLPREHKVRPTEEVFDNMLLEKKNRTPEDMKALQGETAPFEAESRPAKAPYFCEVRNQVGGAYYRPGGDPNLYCWGQLGLATLLNLDKNYWTDCPYPLYPFEITDLAVQVYAGDTCTIWSEGRIYTVDYLTTPHGCAYPDVRICEGGPQMDAHGGGFLWIDIPLDPPCCVYDEFFAAWMFDNSDDFNDTDYCTSTYIGEPLTLIFDASGRQCQSYWGPYAEYTGEPYYGWFDVVPNGLWPGALRIEVLGYTAGQNTCPDPPETWYWKDAFDDSVHYAPSGLPDFYQYQVGFPLGQFGFEGEAWDCPAAGANSIWWFAASSQLNPSWGGWDPTFPPILMNEVAVAAGTNPIEGTECDSCEKAILEVIKAHGGWWYYETTVYCYDFPQNYDFFWYIQDELRQCEDVILLLGFWQEDPRAGWQRFGGHFVTVAGVDIFNIALAFSDPAMGNFENGFGPGRAGAGTFIVPHFPPPPPSHENAPIPDPPTMHPLGYHNDAGNVSHDAYFVAWPSATPCPLWLPDYQMVDAGGVPVWQLFDGLNLGPFPNTLPYNPALPVHVEIEQAIVVSPGPKEMSATVHSSLSQETENNHGGVESFQVNFGAGLEEGMYYGSYVIGTSQADLACDYGDYYPLHTFEPLGPPVCSSFVVQGSAGDHTFEQCTYRFAHPFIPGLEITKYAFGFWVPQGEQEESEYMIEQVLFIHYSGPGSCTLEVAKWKDYDLDPDYMDLSDGTQQYQSKWMWNPADPTKNFGMTKKPANVGDVAITGWGISQAARVYGDEYLDSLKIWMETLGWGDDNPGVPEDRSIIIVNEPVVLDSCQWLINIWNNWGYIGPIDPGGDFGWRWFTYVLLRYLGYYRRDVDKDGDKDISDVIYEINYLFKGGPKPHTFVDQGDVDCDGDLDVGDVVYEINYLFKGGPPPIDKFRPLMESPFVNPNDKELSKRSSLFADPQWRDFGKP